MRQEPFSSHEAGADATPAGRSGPEPDVAEAWRLLSRAFVHEVRSPLNALSINLDLASSRTGSAAQEDVERVRKALGRASAQVGRIDQLLMTFLEVWAPHPGGSCDVTAIVEAVARLASHRAASLGATLEVASTRGAKVNLPGRVVADAVCLLLCEALLPETAVRLTLDEEGGVRLRVEVDGDEAPSLPGSAQTFARLGARVTDRPGFFEAVLSGEG